MTCCQDELQDSAIASTLAKSLDAPIVEGELRAKAAKSPPISSAKA